jgi:pimeloyl-ACP methyl ester carboxylesterase
VSAPLPILLVPGLLATPRFFQEQVPALWRHGPVMFADHRRDDSMAAIARRILAEAPRRFALVGHSMGGYISFEIMRQAADRVAKLALLSTAARPDTPEQTERRRTQIALAQGGRFSELTGMLYPFLVHKSLKNDAAQLEVARSMVEATGPEAFIRQQTAIMARPDSVPGLAAIRCPTLVLVGDSDVVTPPERAAEIANGIAGARRVTVEECGHMCALEKPAETTQALLDWLAA